MKKDHTQTDIAKIVGVHKSTISRELQRNTGERGYRPKQAHGKHYKDAESVEGEHRQDTKKTGLPVLTLTADFGREFGNHEKIARRLKADFYFAHHPYCS